MRYGLSLYQRDQSPSFGLFPRHRWQQGIHALSPPTAGSKSFCPFLRWKLGSRQGKAVLCTADRRSVDLVDFEMRLSAFLDFWQDLDIRDYRQITFVGFSNGANFIMGLLTKQSNLADNYILLHPSVLDYAFPMENSRAEILFTLGQNDQLVDQVALEHLVDDWQASAFPRANLARFDKGHFLSQDELTYIKNWYQERIDKKT
ncbi:TPA: alpha/beta hydrolase [Streptococcus suis]